MNHYDILLLAFALSIDACVVSFSYGVKGLCNPIKSALSLAAFTGFFQGMMPYLGGICTNCVRTYIEPFSKVIVFVVFLYLGINFIKEAVGKDNRESDNKCDRLNLSTLLLIAVATSIDALSAGIPLTLNLDSIRIPVILIGLVTFTNSIIGFFIGKTFRHFNPKCLEILGGTILIILALKVVL